MEDCDVVLRHQSYLKGKMQIVFGQAATGKEIKCPECLGFYAVLEGNFNRNKARHNGFDRRCRACERLRSPEKIIKRRSKRKQTH